MAARQFSFFYHLYDSANALSEQDHSLLQSAEDATRLAYAPYSHFYVGCALQLANGIILKGANQENAAFPSGICAERSVIAMAGNLYPEIPVVKLAIFYKTDHAAEGILSPCGQCRQVISETASRSGQNIQVLMSSPDGRVIALDNSAHLLPFAFSSDFL